MRTVPLLRLLLLSTLACCIAIPASAQNAKAPKPGAVTIQPGSPWLFTGFKLDSKDGVFYAISLDGYHWKLADGGKPVVSPTIPGELMRDPFIRRAPDGSFRMVWTWAWYDPHVIGYAESRDLLHWTPHRELSVMSEPGAANVWAPAMYYEPAKKKWLIFWASTILGRFPGDDSGDTAKLPGGASVGLNHRIYFTTTADFKTFTPAKIFFDPGYSVIDATILPPAASGKPFTLVFKDERKTPLEKHLLTATGPSFEGPWSNISQPISESWSEGAAIIPVEAQAGQPAGFLAYYDHYTQGQHYGAVFSPDLVHWSDALSKIDFPPGMRHGSFLQITRTEYDRLNNLAPDAQPAAATPAATR